MKKVVGIAALGSTLLFGGLVNGGVANAQASENVEVNQTETNEQKKAEYYKYVQDELKKYDVSDEKIKGLINKLENKELWDSINPEMEGTAETIVIDEDTTKLEFPDGSIFVQEVDTGVWVDEEDLPSVNPTATVTHGTVTGGSGYTNYTGTKITGSVVLAAASYKVDFSTIKDGYDSIKAAYSRNITVPGPGGDYTVESWGITQAKETSSSPAKVALQFKAKNDALGATTFRLHFLVSKDSYRTDANL